MTSADAIPCVETYRGIGIHDQQPAERIERVVKSEIDLVLDRLHDIKALYDFARRPMNAPEARLLAAAKIEAHFAVAVEERRARPTEITMELVQAVVAGLNSLHWRSPTHYCSVLDPPPPPGQPRAVPREVPLKTLF